jgi:hypothetical protein
MNCDTAVGIVNSQRISDPGRLPERNPKALETKLRTFMNYGGAEGSSGNAPASHVGKGDS